MNVPKEYLKCEVNTTPSSLEQPKRSKIRSDAEYEYHPVQFESRANKNMGKSITSNIKAKPIVLKNLRESFVNF